MKTRDMMKHMIQVLAVVLIYSCAPTEENKVFDTSSAQRIATNLKEIREVLTGAKNGWLMEYYPDSKQSFGGYNLLLAFTADEVKVSGEIAQFDEYSTSKYSLKQSAGPILSIDTYNKNFHYFSNPNSSISGEGKNGTGMGGDFEFLVLKSTADSVVLKGKKTANRIIMTRFPENINWTDYLKQIQEAAGKMRFDRFEYQVGGDVIQARATKHRRLQFDYQNEFGESVSLMVPYIQTINGYKLYETLNIKGVSVTEFKLVIEGDSEYFIASNGAAVKLQVTYPPINEQLVSGSWYFTFSGLGPFGQAYWKHVKEEGLEKMPEGPERLYYAYMGENESNSYGLNFACADETGGIYHGIFIYKYELIDSDKISYEFTGLGSSTAQTYYKEAKFINLLHPISSKDKRTFTLTTDNIKKPSWIKLIDTAEEKNSIVLQAEKINWPYEN